MTGGYELASDALIAYIEAAPSRDGAYQDLMWELAGQVSPEQLVAAVQRLAARRGVDLASPERLT